MSEQFEDRSKYQNRSRMLTGASIAFACSFASLLMFTTPKIDSLEQLVLRKFDGSNYILSNQEIIQTKKYQKVLYVGYALSLLSLGAGISSSLYETYREEKK